MGPDVSAAIHNIKDRQSEAGASSASESPTETELFLSQARSTFQSYQTSIEEMDIGIATLAQRLRDDQTRLADLQKQRGEYVKLRQATEDLIQSVTAGK